VNDFTLCHVKTDGNAVGNCYQEYPGDNVDLCPAAPTPLPPAEVVPIGETTTDNVCQGKGCDGCMSTSGCGFCRFANGDKSCRHQTLLVLEQNGPDYCIHAGGTWVPASSNDVAHICAPDAATTGINGGGVTAGDVTNDIAADDSLAGLIVIVTVITKVENDIQGRAHFQAFVDVIGDLVPTPAQEKLIRDSIRSSLAKLLTIDIGEIDCVFEPRTKRLTSSYIALLTVGGPPNNMQGTGAAAVSASVGLLALGATAILRL
jgi:hypothetical protein